MICPVYIRCCTSHSSAQSGQSIRQDERKKMLENIPEILICQSLPNEHGFCGDNDCICKNIEIVESGEMCRWMQENRKQELHNQEQP
jgi:hypothetical protein